MSKVMSKDILHSTGNFPVYNRSHSETAFLLGGIGTGNISVGARGQLMDFEIFGTSGKGNCCPHTFFAIRAKAEDEKPVLRVLEAGITPPFSKSHGFVDREVAGLPRFTDCEATSRYPFFNVKFKEDGLPIEAEMESFTPFIPLNADDSGIPAGILRYKVKNTSDKPMEVSIAGSVSNLSTLKRYEQTLWKGLEFDGDGENRFFTDGDVKGIFFGPKIYKPDSIFCGNMTLATTEEDYSYKRAWLDGGWWDGLQDMWDDFAEDGRLEKESVYTQKDVTGVGKDKAGSLAIHKTIAPDAEETFTFILSWYFPNRVNSWSTSMYDNEMRGKQDSCCSGSCCCPPPVADGEYPSIKKYYAMRYRDSRHVACDTYQRLGELERLSRSFADALYSTTLPDYVIETTANNITILRSNTCFRLEDGTLMAWEGCFFDEGCCEGNCTHVWNYAQTIAYLFPELERTMRLVEYMTETETGGKMNFRSYKLWGMGGHDHVPAADGQMGTFVRLYREWRFSGDDEFLLKVWPNAKSTLDFAFEYWDKDGDFVFETNQFNTYDIGFVGPNSMVNSLFYAALKAGAEICAYLGDTESEKKYRNAFEQGSKRMDELLWGGEYYVQQIEDVNEYRYQYGAGCLSDQIFGQTLAHLAGLGHILPAEHVKLTAKSIFDHNFLPDFTEHWNTQRTYVLGKEQGLLLCTWQNAERPRLPFPYSDEVWPGIEYQVATTLIYEGYIDEALTIVKAVRDRHDGIRRNPFNEVECGHHYARSLASYGVYAALCGFDLDMPNKTVSFDPKLNADSFRAFYAAGGSWGIYERTKGEDGQIRERLVPLYGNLDGLTLKC